MFGQILSSAAAALTILIASGGVAQSETVLVMVEEQGCIYCARWNRDVATEYPKTAEGRAAPLRRIDIHGDAPDDITFLGPVVYTPTFVLVMDGTEVSRLEGYPGEDFFWGLLQLMLIKAGTDYLPNG